MGSGVSRRDFLVTAGVGAAALAAGRRAAAQDKKTLVVAWDSDIDSLDPAVFKSQGAYVTVANTTDAPLMWKVRPIDIASPTLFIEVVRIASAPGNFSKAKRGNLTTT